MKFDELKERYSGDRAANYDRDRVDSSEWRREQDTVENFLEAIGLGRGDVVLDVPVGTGRFLDLYAKHGCHVLGLDISDDMLKQAVTRADQAQLDADLRVGDITNIDAADSSAKVVVCVRIFNLLEFTVFRRALAEVARVSDGYVIAGIQIRRERGSNRSGFSSIPILRKLRVREPRSDQKSRTTSPHPEGRVMQQFRKHGLTIARQETVVDSSATPYYLYLLRKSS